MNIKFIFPVASALVLVACQSAPAADKATASSAQQVSITEGKTIDIDTSASQITWVGTKPTGQHEGQFKISNGELTIKNDKLAGGSFVIDIKSLNNMDLEGEWKKKLEDHLLSADFFDAANFPTAVFTITSVDPVTDQQTSLLPGATHYISGNLQLKDSTRNISFPAIIENTATGIGAKANFNIDRRQWGMSYGSDKSLQDKFISPEVNIQLDLKSQN